VSRIAERANPSQIRHRWQIPVLSRSLIDFMYTISEFSSSTKSHETKYHRFKKGVATENVPSCTGHRFKIVRFKFHHLFLSFFTIFPPSFLYLIPVLRPGCGFYHLAPARTCPRCAVDLRVESSNMYIVPISVVWYELELCYTRLVTRNATHTWRLRLLLPPCSYPF